jgi:hypothetical protein
LLIYSKQTLGLRYIAEDAETVQSRIASTPDELGSCSAPGGVQDKYSSDLPVCEVELSVVQVYAIGVDLHPGIHCVNVVTIIIRVLKPRERNKLNTHEPQ